MSKIVINTCFGGFGLSNQARHMFAVLKGLYGSEMDFDDSDIERNDPDLVDVLESLGTGMASGPNARLDIVELEIGTRYIITNYDGFESIQREENFRWLVA